MHQLPSQPSNSRVWAWRQLQQLGAINIKQAVYVLPDSITAREGFQRLIAAIEDAGGEASVFSSHSVDASSDDALVAAFQQSRQRAYEALASELEKVIRRLNGRGRRRAGRQSSVPQMLEQFRQRLGAAERLDFFAAPGRDRVVTLLGQLDAKLRATDSDADPAAPDRRRQNDFRGRLWVTRPRPGVDRLASAWLIRRFIDPQARFDFVIDRRAITEDALPFDMSEVEFSHHGEHCTFETLCDRFDIAGAPVGRIAAIVHDLDLKDERFGAPETATIGSVIQGLQLAHASDDALLEHGIALFEALYRSLAQTPRPGVVPRRKQP